MDPREARSAGDADEETIARKRARRVSFADTTAVHVFDRDDDSESPHESRSVADGVDSRMKSLMRSPDRSESDDSRGSMREEDEEEDEEQEKFVRDMDLSSPGSVAGSVTSNDDDNFFGPVSTSFIRTGRFSDSGMSDDSNHDVTLDSTAFSLHFRNIALPDDFSVNSAGSLRTPTGDSIPADSSNLVIPKGFKKSISLNKSSDGKLGGSSSHSNNMSLIVDNPNKYDYGKISPKLGALLAEVNKSMQSNPPDSDSRVVTPSHRNESIDAENSRKEVSLKRCMTALDNEADDNSLYSQLPNNSSASICANHVGDRNFVSDMSSCLRTDPLIISVKQDAISSVDKFLHEDVHASILTGTKDAVSPTTSRPKIKMTLEPDEVHQDKSVTGSKSHSNSSLKSPMKQSPMVASDGQPQLLESEFGMCTPKSAIQPSMSVPQGSVLFIHTKRQHIFSDPVNDSVREQLSSSIKVELVRHSERISAIKNRIPKFKVPETPILITQKASWEDDMRCQFEGSSQKISNDPATTLEDVYIMSNKTRGEEIGGGSHCLDSDSLKGNQELEQNQVTEIAGVSPRLVESDSSPRTELNMMQNHLTSKKLNEGLSGPDAHGSVFKDITAELTENGLSGDSSHKILSLLLPEPSLPLSQNGYLTPKADVTVRLRPILSETESISASNYNKMKSFRGAIDMGGNGSLYSSPKKVEISKNICSESQDKNVEVRNICTKLGEKLSEMETVASSFNSAFKDGNKEAETANNMIKCLAEVATRNPTETDNCALPSFTSTNLVPPNSYEETGPNDDVDCYQKSCASPQQHSAQSVDIVGRKRGFEEVLFMHRTHTNEICRTQKSPKISAEVSGTISGFLSGCNVEYTDKSHNFGVQATLENRTDILSKALETTKHLFRPSVYKLKAKEMKLGILEDLLGELHMSRKYGRLPMKILPLKSHDPSDDLHQQRVAEARTLLATLVQEQTKLQLKHVKLDQLCKKAEKFQSGIQECCKTKSILTQYLAHGTRPLSHSSSTSEFENQEEESRLTLMKQEAHVLDQKVNFLMKSFEASCKLNGNMDSDGIIKVVGQHLKLKSQQSAVHRDLRLWELSGTLDKNDQFDIVLNYCSMLSQRFSLKMNQASSIFVKNLFNNIDIDKNFPGMGAYVAFEFVFKAKDGCRLSGLKSLQQQTLVTSFLLGTLLDVLGEIQVARIQTSNLVVSNFLSHCSGQLELQLCFLCFESSCKVTLSLDMTDLNCGVYPSEPSQFHVKLMEGKTTLPASVQNEIISAVQSLRRGRPLILELCQRVSQVVQPSS